MESGVLGPAGQPVLSRVVKKTSLAQGHVLVTVPHPVMVGNLVQEISSRQNLATWNRVQVNNTQLQETS